MNEVTVKINDKEMKVREFNGKRVVTFKDVDMVHEKPEGSAKDRFNKNRKRFILGEDYYIVKPSDLENTEKYAKHTFGIEVKSPRGLTLLTETGYLMLTKTFDDDLAWKVQRQLVDTYFTIREMAKSGEFVSMKEYNKLLEQIEEIKKCIIENKDNIAKTDVRLSLLESSTSAPGCRISKWIQDISKEVQLIAKADDYSVKKEYSKIIGLMEDIYGMLFQKYYDEYAATHPNQKPIWRLVVIEYYGLQAEFEEAMVRRGREVGVYEIPEYYYG